MFNFLNSLKDRGISKAAKVFIQGKVERYGDMIELKIDSRKKRIELMLQLKGEDSPISVEVSEYLFMENEGTFYIQIGKLNSSKEWLNLLAEDFVVGKKIELPSQFKNTLKMFL